MPSSKREKRRGDAVGKKRKRRRRDDSNSSDASSSNEISTEETTPTRRSSDARVTTEAQRNTRKKEDKMIIRMLKELKEEMQELKEEMQELKEEMRKKLKKLTESHSELRKQVELHINGSSADDAAAPRSEPNQLQPPRYRLEFKCKVNEKITKGEVIKTTNHDEVITTKHDEVISHEKVISVALFDDHDQLVETGPLAYATVMLVVVNGEFNQHDTQCNWSREEFVRNIVRPRGNSATRDVNQSVESIVSNNVFKLNGGFQNHGDAAILYNSSNKKVRLGVMVLSPMEERVREGLSNPFFVRGHDRPGKQLLRKGSRRQGQAPVGYGCGEQNGLIQNSSFPHLDQPPRFSFAPAAVPPQLPGLIPGSDPAAGQFTSGSIPQDQFCHSMYGTSMTQTTHSLHGDEQLPLLNGFVDPNSAPRNYSIGNVYLPVPTNGTQLNRNTLFPVQLMWDRPNVEPSKRWNLLDQLMPLYSCKAKFNNCDLPTMCLMTEHLNSLTFIPKELMQTRRKKGVLIEPLEPDDSDEDSTLPQRPLKRRLHSNYRLRFVNKVCEAYYKGEQIKADDGNLVKVALVNETNTTITSGPLSSASVEIVVLHGDFNVDGQDYWTSQEFSRCIVCPGPGKEATVLGGDRTLDLADGEACLGDSFFRVTSFHARTGKFKMGVMLASSQDERIQEGTSEAFVVRDRHPWKGLPPGFRFHPTDKELIVHYLRNRVAAAPCPVHIVAEVDIYMFDPWGLPGMALIGDDQWYFFCPRKHGGRPIRAAGSGYWKATGKDRTVAWFPKGLGIKKEFVFYRGRPPKGDRTSWSMHEYRLAAAATTSSSSTSSMTQDEWVLCKIYSKDLQLQLSSPMDDEEGFDDDHVHEYLSFTDLPPGLRFHPTDKELIIYLRKRVSSAPCPAPVVAEVDDILKFEPCDLPAKAVIGDDQWCFFCPLDHNNYSATCCVHDTGVGFWMAIGRNEPIHLTGDKMPIGFRRTLSFVSESEQKGETSWMMHEYRLADSSNTPSISSAEGSSSSPQEWLLYRLFREKNQLQRSPFTDDDGFSQSLQQDSDTSTDDSTGRGRRASCSPRRERMTAASASGCIY